MFVSHRPRSYEIEDFEIVPGFRVKVYEGDYYPQPDHEIIYILDGQQVGRELSERYAQRLEEIKANPQEFIEAFKAKECEKSQVERAWELGGFGKPL